MTDVAVLVGDLEAEQLELQAILAGVDADAWLTPTPAWGWDVRDTIAHLADTDEMAIDTARGGPYAINDLAQRAASTAAVTYHGVLRGRRLAGPDVGAWWARTSADERSLLRSLPADARVPWGLGMRTPSFVTARLMETWAHGLDVRSALGIPAVDTDRLAHVAWLATRALPYAYSVAGRAAPGAPVRVELTLPSGAAWANGPETAADRISGSAADYCRVFVHRRAAADTNLVIEGDAARAAISVARAFL
ncbi:MAG TPA: maleylpyruvate isomerase family mycothiol-dependent enzyme [Acidimicrobiia bacterium]|nr:maleylpyruvate isomerase family mycothiol-dependent enzyme [Acidimicrobiia bacterium]